MRWLLLPLFLIKLAWAELPFFFKLGWVYLDKWTQPSLTGLLVLAQAAVLFHLLKNSSPQQIQPLLPLPPQAALNLSAVSEVKTWQINTSPSELESTLTTLEKLKTLQPYHRDVLIDLSILYSLQGQPNQAQSALRQAQALDPNFSAFQN